ncbi:hypothetical protein BD779DRAFT_1515418 [Infundibulicybe gibba]|nr:hypothetical protein BD779DRAFT_1515418 [Infundibulicybe gibba]
MVIDPPPVQGSLSPIDLKVRVCRGDYSCHCHRLASWNASYLGADKLPGPPDTSDAGLQRCLPNLSQIAGRFRQVHSSLPRPTTASVYILSNVGKYWSGIWGWA